MGAAGGLGSAASPDIKNACSLALNFLEARFAVIIDDTVIGQKELSQYVEAFAAAGVGVHLVRLMPSLAVCQERNAKRDRQQRMRPDRVEAAYRAIEAAGDLGGGDRGHGGAIGAADGRQAAGADYVRRRLLRQVAS